MWFTKNKTYTITILFSTFTHHTITVVNVNQIQAMNYRNPVNNWIIIIPYIRYTIKVTTSFYTLDTLTNFPKIIMTKIFTNDQIILIHIT